MARHSAPQNPTARRAALVAATAGVALGAGAGMAAAASEPVLPTVQVRNIDMGRIDPQAGLRGLGEGLRYVLGALGRVKPNPIADTPVDVFNNGVGTRIADFPPLYTQALTRPVAEAPTIGSMPLLSQLPGMNQSMEQGAGQGVQLG
ncbi:hypothetical protein [Streptomyces poonensis]|uniref:Secreted protein n=1 Tax=Streptomyces poonensis TaxID=68255 RepID=A0A918P8J6_9ACTN|nr:hypothetical protein [Streptomyces poonensis]GGY91645.1 hypothetical protein GCM10010365_07600 [Streptomyces poonensis]GLJ87802.1 hypothetical protein GCM10017589_04020 [Streptomyces poonensis]